MVAESDRARLAGRPQRDVRGAAGLRGTDPARARAEHVHRADGKRLGERRPDPVLQGGAGPAGRARGDRAVRSRQAGGRTWGAGRVRLPGKWQEPG